MKKIFVLLFISMSLIGYAQKFQLTDLEGNSYTNGQTIVLGITENDLNPIGEFIADFKVKNITDNRLRMQTTRTDIVLIEGMIVSLCVGDLCYPSDVYSVDPYTIEAGKSENVAFHLTPNNKFGLCQFKLDFETEGEMITLYLNIDMQHLGIKENNNSTFTLSAFPNPASEDSRINISYSITDLNGKQNLVIRNVLGTAVMTMSLNPYENSTYIYPSTLKSGIYFYSIENKKQISIAKKLIVK
jgi:hypothetical protein